MSSVFEQPNVQRCNEKPYILGLSNRNYFRKLGGVETPETPESLAGLKYLKEKIVAAMNKNGMEADINSPEIHAKAIEMRASLDKKGLIKPAAGNQIQQQSSGA